MFTIVTFVALITKLTIMNKTEVISLRLEKKVKDELAKMAKADRRELPDFLRLILSDIADKKIKITL